MRTRVRWWQVALAVCCALPALATAGVGDDPETPSASHIVIDFSTRNPDSNFRGKRGIFRDPKESPDLQFISDDVATEDIRGGTEQMSFLRLAYRLGAPGSFNGYWIQPDPAGRNWEAYRGGAIVVRVGAGEKTPPLFLLEVKTADAEGSPQTTFPVYVALADPKTHEAMHNQGYADVIIFMKDLAITRNRVDPDTLKLVRERKTPNFSNVTELTFVFEHDRLPKEKRTGVLKINSIKLVKDVPRP